MATETRRPWTPQTRVEAFAMLKRAVEDWPYQPPEVVGPEQEAFAAWLVENQPPPADYLAALSGGAS